MMFCYLDTWRSIFEQIGMGVKQLRDNNKVHGKLVTTKEVTFLGTRVYTKKKRKSGDRFTCETN